MSAGGWALEQTIGIIWVDMCTYVFYMHIWSALTLRFGIQKHVYEIPDRGKNGDDWRITIALPERRKIQGVVRSTKKWWGEMGWIHNQSGRVKLHMSISWQNGARQCCVCAYSQTRWQMYCSQPQFSWACEGNEVASFMGECLLPESVTHFTAFPPTMLTLFHPCRHSDSLRSSVSSACAHFPFHPFTSV